MQVTAEAHHVPHIRECPMLPGKTLALANVEYKNRLRTPSCFLDSSSQVQREGVLRISADGFKKAFAPFLFTHHERATYRSY